MIQMKMMNTRQLILQFHCLRKIGRPSSQFRRNTSGSQIVLIKAVCAHILYQSRDFERVKLQRNLQKKLVDISCRWIFKRCKVYSEGTVYIKIYAKYSTCEAHFTGTVLTKLDNTQNKDVKFNFKIFDFDLKGNKGKEPKNVKVSGTHGNKMYKRNGPPILTRILRLLNYLIFFF